MKDITNEQEILETLERQAFLIEQKLSNKILTLDDFGLELGEHISVIASDLDSFLPVHMDNNGAKMLATSKTIYMQNPQDFIDRLVFPGDFEKNAKLVARHFASDKSNLPISFIQRIKLYDKNEYEGLYTLAKKVKSLNSLVNIAIRVNSVGKVTMKMLRLLEETDYMRKNYQRFASLTTREKEIITLLALGYQNNEIAEQLFISKATVEQHRKNLKRKLEIKRFVDLIRFAQAFDLI